MCPLPPGLWGQIRVVPLVTRGLCVGWWPWSPPTAWCPDMASSPWSTPWTYLASWPEASMMLPPSSVGHAVQHPVTTCFHRGLGCYSAQININDSGTQLCLIVKVKVFPDTHGDETSQDWDKTVMWWKQRPGRNSKYFSNRGKTVTLVCIYDQITNGEECMTTSPRCRSWLCITGLLQGHDVRDSTTVPSPPSLEELPEDLDVRNLRVGIPKVRQELTSQHLEYLKASLFRIHSPTIWRPVYKNCPFILPIDH